MRLKPSYDQMSDVPADYKNAYTEQDGKAVFTGGDFEFKTEGDVTAMKKAKDNANNELSETKAKLKAFEGIEPDKHKALVEENEVLRAKVKDGGSDEETIKAIVDARVARKTEELTSENKNLRETNNKLESFKLKTEKSSLLNESLSKHVSKEARSDAEFILGSIMERQADGTYMSNGQGGFDKGLSVEQVVTKALESRPHWKKQNTAGHGSSGSNGGGGKSKLATLHEMTIKNAKGELSTSEVKQMNALAAEIQAEQQEG